MVKLEKLSFNFDEFTIRSEARDALDRNAQCLKEAAGFVDIIIEGHADARGTQGYNLALGEKRANVVREYLLSFGINPRSMTVRSIGENRPLCQQLAESCYQRNRRVEFVQIRR